MPLEQFKELFSLALQRYDDDDSGWTPDNMEDYEKYQLESMLLNALIIGAGNPGYLYPG